jgi:sugar lactone lactonase YvrE
VQGSGVERGSARLLIVALVVGLLAPLLGAATVRAAPPANDAFRRTWERTDKPVADLRVSRTWMWGGEALTGPLTETYQESQGGARTVQYFDKSRMEITWDRSIPEDSIWYVTNGLLVNELISGQMQVGNNAFQPRRPANVNVAGDPDDTNGPTYATFASLLNAPPVVQDVVLVNTVDRAGRVGIAPRFADYGVTAAWFVPETNHMVASVFWAFMNSSGLVYEDGSFSSAPLFQNPFYATGYPITEAYWASIKVAHVQLDVLMQCFERRCLTYTPGNDEGWQVEAGNVGLHYYIWRYEEQPQEGYVLSRSLGGFNQPRGIELDSIGNLYVADSGANALVKLNADGQIVETWTTYAGGALNAPRDVALDEFSGTGLVYVLDGGNRIVRLLTNGNYDDQWPLTGTPVSNVARSVETDLAGRVYVAGGSAIVRYDMQGAVTGQRQITGADIVALAWDAERELLWVADRATDRVIALNMDTGQQVHVLTGFTNPSGVAVDDRRDGDGSIFVSDTGANRIVRLREDGERLATWGSLGSGEQQLNAPGALAFAPNGWVYVADTGNNRVQVFRR